MITLNNAIELLYKLYDKYNNSMVTELIDEVRSYFLEIPKCVHKGHVRYIKIEDLRNFIKTYCLNGGIV